MMKKKAITLLTCLTAWVACTQGQNYISLDEARGVVDAYYSSLQMIISDPRGDGSINGQKMLYLAVGKDNNGNAINGELTVPNDLEQLTNRSTNGNTRLANYLGSLRDMASNDGFALQYQTRKCEYLRGPEMKSEESDPTFARVVVNKTITSTKFGKTAIDDTLYVDAHTKSIAIVTNKFGTTYRQDIARMDYANLKPYAARMYADKNYNEAFRAYERVLQFNPTDSEASYSLGVMCYKGQGCLQYSRKVRDYMAEFYWQKSTKGLDRLKETYNKGKRIHYTCYSNLEPSPFICNRMLIIDKGKKKGSKFGYMTPEGDMVIKQEYSFAFPFFDNGTAIVCTEKGQWLMIDTMGRVLDIYGNYGFNHDGDATIFHLFVKDRDGKMIIFNRRTGEQESSTHYDRIMWSYFAIAVLGADKGLFVVSKEGSYGLVVPQYGEVIPCKYRNMKYIKWKDRDCAIILVDYDDKALNLLKVRNGEYSKIPIEELITVGTPVAIYWSKEVGEHLRLIYYDENTASETFYKTK